MYVCIRLVTVSVQESLANAKVYAQQQCVSLSCLYEPSRIVSDSSFLLVSKLCE